MRSTHNLFNLIWAAFFVAAIAPLGHAQKPRNVATNQAGGQMVLQTYEVGDLVFSVPDYTISSGGGGMLPRSTGGGMSGGGGGNFGRGMAMEMGGGGGMMEGGGMPAPGGLPMTVNAIIEVIQTTVTPNTWQIAGGEGRASALGTSLVVLQTPDAQEAISQLLQALREGSGGRRSMTVDARWLVLDSNDLEKLVVVGEDGEPKINRETLATFTRQPTSLRAVVSCFSGQAVYLTSGTVRSSVSSYIPVVGSIESPKSDPMFAASPSDGRISFVSDEQPRGFGGGRNVGYQPVITTNNFGVEFQVRPTRLHPEKAAVVDLRSTITFPADPLGRSQLDTPEEALAPQVDRVDIQTQELATTLRVPLGEPVLVGGMTDVAPRTAPGTGVASGELAEGAGAGERRQLYLVLEVR